MIGSRVALRQPLRAVRRLPATPAAPPPVAALMLPLRQLRDDQCRWPIGDPGRVRFLRATGQRPASPYCAHHHAYNRAQPGGTHELIKRKLAGRPAAPRGAIVSPRLGRFLAACKLCSISRRSPGALPMAHRAGVGLRRPFGGISRGGIMRFRWAPVSFPPCSPSRP